MVLRSARRFLLKPDNQTCLSKAISCISEWPSQHLIDEKQYTVYFGISYAKSGKTFSTHNSKVSRVYYKELRDWFHKWIFTILTILVLSEPVNISEYIVPVCIDWSMEYPLLKNDILEYEGIIGYNAENRILLKGPSKCVGHDGCINIFGNIRDINNDTVCCEQPVFAIKRDRRTTSSASQQVMHRAVGGVQSPAYQ
ncbi:Peptidase S1, PA clan [Cinara cedri]|uniref:Peptidase S1, PA clan n=1 Tax=Cinara cedri TaxID=506608 RepID=A0A5E4MKL2_9HEMI|nr:Peptidase S1, PA clan [Cinara cedri]